eukprot:gene11325-23703_t
MEPTFFNIFDLPHEIIATICSDYITIDDLKNLNLACNEEKSADRMDLLKSLSKVRSVHGTTIKFGSLCSGLNGDDLEWLSIYCSGLHRLSVGCSQKINIRDGHLKLIGDGFPSLRILDLSNCFGISDTGLLHVVKQCTRLTEIILSDCYNVTDVGIKYISSNCPFLERLDISLCSDITDSSMRSLAECCPVMSEINVSGCRYIDHAVISTLSDNYPRLHFLLYEEKPPDSSSEENNELKLHIQLNDFFIIRSLLKKNLKHIYFDVGYAIIANHQLTYSPYSETSSSPHAP